MSRTPLGLSLLAVASTITIPLLTAFAAGMQGSRGHNAFFRPPENASRTASPSRFARASPRSLASDPAGPAHVLWVETLSHTRGVSQELALSRYLAGEGWDSVLTPIARWEGEPSTEPAVVIDRRRVLHIVWLEQGETSRAVMGLRFDQVTGELTDPMPISEPGRSAADPALAVDLEGRVHVVWSEIEAGRPVLRHRQGDGSGWQPVAMVPRCPGGAGAFSPEIACDSGGVLHLVWTEALGGATVPMVVRRTPSGQWDEPERLADVHEGSFSGPPVVCAGGDRVWVAWAEAEGKEGRVMVRSRTRNRWSKASSPSRAASFAEQPSGAIDAWGTLHLVWLERRTESSQADPTSTSPTAASVAYSSCNPGDSLWSAPRSLTAGEGQFDSPVIAADASGRVIAAWVDRGSGAGDIVCRHGIAGFTTTAAPWYRR